MIVCYFHERNVCLRNLTPKNIIIIKEKLKLVDFDFLSMAQEELSEETLLYFAPEIKKEYS